jgi:hypothetical protein
MVMKCSNAWHFLLPRPRCAPHSLLYLLSVSSAAKRPLRKHGTQVLSTIKSGTIPDPRRFAAHPGRLRGDKDARKPASLGTQHFVQACRLCVRNLTGRNVRCENI